MKEGKHTVKKNKTIEVYLMLILIATLLMSVGYAKISDVYLGINGEVEAIAQDGVFIKNVTSENTDTASSKVNYYIETVLDSQVELGTTSTATTTYNITLYNNSLEEYIFIGTITDKADTNINNNDNIEFSINGLKEYETTISPNGTLVFSITFKYKDKANITSTSLKSRLNFRFKETPTLVLSNEGEIYELKDIYPGYESEGYQFTVSNFDTTKTNCVPMKYLFETKIESPLTAKIYNEKGQEVIDSIEIIGDGSTQETHTYTIKIVWDNSITAEYNDLNYAGKEFKCEVALKTTPQDEKYIDYEITKKFNINVNTAPFAFNVSPTSASVVIKNDVATLALTINNYTSDTNYNKFDTNYEISIADNIDFTLNNATNGVIAKTLSGGNKVEENLNIGITGDMTNLDITETLTLKLVSKAPYVKEIEVPVTINLHSVAVTLNANGGTVNTSSITVYQSKKYENLPTPTWAGHKFNGWYTATSGGTKITTETEVTTTSSTQTLYAQWTSILLADLVQVGDYVNYPVSYANVAVDKDGYIAKSSYTGWRVLSIEGTGSNKYVRLITAGVPMTYRHASSSGAGASSVEKLVNNFFGISITTSTNYTFNSCGFKNSAGNTVTSIGDLKTLFNNKYTQVSNNVPVVKSITKADLDKVWGSTTVNGQNVSSKDLISIPSTTSSTYTSYYLATAEQSNYLWASYQSGCVVYTYAKQGIRPVVSLKATVETSGKSGTVWQLQ